jgi:hypothetical protein
MLFDTDHLIRKKATIEERLVCAKIFNENFVNCFGSFTSRLGASQESWVETDVADVVTIQEPAQESFNPEAIAPVLASAELPLQSRFVIN